MYCMFEGGHITIGGRPHNMSSLGHNYLVFEDKPILLVLNFAPTLLYSHTPACRWLPQRHATKKLDYSLSMRAARSTISTIFIPRSLPYSAGVIRIWYSANYTYSKFCIPQSTLTHFLAASAAIMVIAIELMVIAVTSVAKSHCRETARVAEGLPDNRWE